MFAFVQPLIERLKAAFALHAAQELERDVLVADVERKAELLRQANHYEAEGLLGIAQHLRRRAESIMRERPLASVLPALQHLRGEGESNSSLLPFDGETAAVPALAPPALPKKKGK